MTTPALPPLEPTPRTTVTRGRNRSVTDRAALHELLSQALVGHIGVTMGEHPAVIPTVITSDPDGPDQEGTLYVHGSVAAGWLKAAIGSTVCVTLTEVDGIVAARSAFHHSVNYRSAVVIGQARLVTDEAERLHALALTINQLVPGRAATLRPHTRKELAATAVIAVPLAEASMKVRATGAHDEPEDVASGVWAGVIPLHRVAGAPITNDDAAGEPPMDVISQARRLGAEC